MGCRLIHSSLEYQGHLRLRKPRHFVQPRFVHWGTSAGRRREGSSRDRPRPTCIHVGGALWAARRVVLPVQLHQVHPGQAQAGQ